MSNHPTRPSTGIPTDRLDEIKDEWASRTTGHTSAEDIDWLIAEVDRLRSGREVERQMLHNAAAEIKRLREIERCARGVQRTASAMIGNAVVAQWWDALRNALAAPPGSTGEKER